MSTSKARIRAASAALLTHLRTHHDQTREDLEQVVARYRIPLDKVLQRLADQGYGHLAVEVGGTWKRNLTTRAADIEARRNQSLSRLFGDLKRQARSSRGLANRHPNNKRIAAQANVNDAEAIRIGLMLGLNALDIVAELQPVET